MRAPALVAGACFFVEAFVLLYMNLLLFLAKINYKYEDRFQEF